MLTADQIIRSLQREFPQKGIVRHPSIPPDTTSRFYEEYEIGPGGEPQKVRPKKTTKPRTTQK